MKSTSIDWCLLIPNHWKELRIKDLALLQSGNSITSEYLDDNAEFPVFGGNGIRGNTDTYTNDGDFILIGRQGALCGNINYAHGKFFASEHAVVVYPYRKEVLHWFGETLRMANLNRLSMSAAQPGLSVSTLNNQIIPYPPHEERLRIAIYLDEKTAAIDKQVLLLEQKKEKYTLLRKSIIKKAVTEGVKGETRDWKWMRFKDITKNLFLGQTPIYSEDENEHFIFGQKNNQEYGIDWSGVKFATPNFYSTRREYEFLQKDDVMLNSLGGGSVGRVGYFDIDKKDILTDGHIIVIRCNKMASGKYIYYYLSVKRSELENEAIGSTNQMFLTIPDIQYKGLNLPPLSEQRAIADYLDEKCAKIDAIVANINQQIEKYKLLRRALINEVVTGKKII